MCAQSGGQSSMFSPRVLIAMVTDTEYFNIAIMESRKGTAMTSEENHQVTLSVSFVQAIDKPVKEPSYQESYRDGQRKRIYEALPPEHYYHYEYQLLPGQRGVEGQKFKTDVVCFGGVVTKVYTDRDSRVVQCWEEREAGLNHFGWKHKHTFKVNKALLLDLYDHTLEVRVWTSKNKLSARARYDRPKAFRLPADNIPKNTHLSEDEPQDHEIVRRPSKLPVVSHDQVRNRLSKRRLKQVSTLSVKQTTSNQTVQQSDSVASAASLLRVPAMEPAIIEEDGEKKQTDNQLVPFVPSNETEVSSAPSRVLSRRALKRRDAELAEQARVDREGVAVLRLKMADIFSKDGSVKTQLPGDEQHKELKQLEVGVSLATPLMPDTLLKELNPMMITITKISGLPTMPTSHQELRDRCVPAYVKYQFHTQPSHTSPGQPQSPSIAFNNTHVILLGTIDPPLLVEYLRGPPMIVEVHDRDVRISTNTGPSLFGSESRDEVLGTHAFAAAVAHSSEEALTSTSHHPWNHYGVAKLDLGGLFQGQRMIQITTPVTSGPRGPQTPSGGQQQSAALPPGDYVGSQCELTAIVELTYPLSTPSPVTPLATPTRKSTSKAPPADFQSKVSPRTPKRVKTSSACPFNRLVYVISNVGNSLVKSVLMKVNELNAKALHLEELPPKILLAALSTYKLTREQMTSGECDIITGYHVEDWEQHIIVLEGLKEGRLKEIWENMPRHNTQDEVVIKVFYNSEFAFSSRLYACLDVDLPRIKFYQPLSELTQQSLLYIRDMIPQTCFRALMCLSELTKVSEMADLTRNNLLLTAEEVAALSLQFAHPSTAHSVEDVSALSGQELTPQRPGTPDLLQHMPMHRVWEPLDMTNPLYERLLSERPHQLRKDFIKKNILHTETLSSSKNPRRSQHHQRSFSESSVPAHNYSSQTLNSTELAHNKMRERFDPAHRYTYCQRYHSMTVVPIDVEAERRAHRLEVCSKWRTSKGFIYPGMKTARESNINEKKPHPSRIDDLTESFEDNLLHADTLKPTIQRDKLPYSSDFERWKCPPHWLGPVPPITIHLAGQSRQQEVKEFTDKAEERWRDKLIVDDINFHTHRKGVRTELEARGPRAATQLDKLQDLLKSPPNKHSLRHNDFKLDPIPALSVVHNPSVDPHVNILVTSSPPDDVRSQLAGYYPGPNDQQSLKRDCNVIPRTGVHRVNQQKREELHTQEFRPNYRTAEVLSRRPILPLSQEEKTAPLFHNTPPPNTQNRTTLEQST